MAEKHDIMLSEMLQEEKNLVKFFDTIFGFLKRRTDFYCIAKSPNDPLGLPEGFAEKIVYDSLVKYKPKVSYHERDIAEQYTVPGVEHEEICSTEEPIVGIETKEAVAVEQSSGEMIKSEKTDSYNGAVYENYSWSQSITDLDLQVKVPSNFSSKDLIVSILPSHITVRLKNEDKAIIDGDLHRKIKGAESFWSLDGSYLQIHLEKQAETWWERFLAQEPMLDLHQMDCSRPLEDLPDAAQAKIEQLRWDAEQKNRGLPSSRELDRENTLRKAWDAEGSPFKGTPYDPTLITFEG